MGILYRAVLGFCLAYYAYDSQSARQWLQYAVVTPVQARCAEGLNLCGSLRSERPLAAGELPTERVEWR